MQTSDERHLLLRVRVPDELPAADGNLSRLTVEVEAQVDRSSIYPGGRVDINLDALRRVELQEDDPDGKPQNQYGCLLAQSLTARLPLQAALATLSRSNNVRVQLLLEPAGYPLSLLRWERLQFSQLSELPLSCDIQTPFSRFASVNREEIAPPADTDFHLLAFVANPLNNPGFAQISASAEINALVGACTQLLQSGWMRLTVLPGQQGLDQATLKRCADLNINVLSGPSTIERVSQHLAGPDNVSGLHVVAHGAFYQDSFHLFLEGEEGDLAPAPEDKLLHEWQLKNTRMIYLQSCQSAVDGRDPRPHVGSFMQHLVECGVPGVVAMQDFIRTDDAGKFCSAFYTSLARDGSADRAVNAGRFAIANDGSARWSIPAFATRLSDGSVWKQSAVRFAKEKLRQRITASRNARHITALPLDVISVPQSSLTLVAPKGADEFATLPAQSTLKVDAEKALRASLEPEGRVFTALIGKRGRDKRQLLESLYLAATQHELRAAASDRLCLVLRLSDLSHPGYDGEDLAIARAVAAYFEDLTGVTLDVQDLTKQFEQKACAFLIHGDDTFGDVVRNGLRVLENFAGTDAKSKHRFVLTLDENQLRVRDLPGIREEKEDNPETVDTQCLIIQPMRPERIRQFLSDPGNAKGSPERDLLEELEKNALFDLAEVPWLLREMLGLARRKSLRPSRAKIIGRIINDDISRYKGSATSAVRLRGTLQRFAWEALTHRNSCLPGAEAFDILQKLRGNRDYPLSNFLSDIIESCNVLAYIGEDGIGFNYPGFRAFCAAEYLLNLPEEQRTFHLEEITAQLGRQSRANLWCETLYILAGLWKETTRLLRMILSGSLLYQGDQLFIAVRCLQEARLSFLKDAPRSDSRIVQSIVGSLLQQISPIGLRSVTSRIKAIDHLGPLREPCALDPLLSLVVDCVRPGRGGLMCFDYSAVRLAAMKALRYVAAEETQKALASRCKWADMPQLARVVEAWFKNDCSALQKLLDEEKDPVSAIAALALGLSLDASAYPALKKAFIRADISVDTRWAVTDSLIELAHEDLENFVRSCITDGVGDKEMLAHMAGKLGKAAEGSPEWQFLQNNLKQGEDRLAGRSLQALAELSARDIIPTCHSWLDRQESHLAYFAMQALRLIGRHESLKKIEDLRWDPQRNDTSRIIFLDSVRLEVYESIYWRLVGGLSRETMALPDTDEPKPKPTGAST
ncbi:MAG TPA: CHAT domain-containing protein [Bryobacteraceae bacterium]|jgi:hypothetical protein|nr:CHAT domain-containing protein [Bryobacteraceae bacterium]